MNGISTRSHQQDKGISNLYTYMIYCICIIGIYILYIEIGDHGVKRDGRDTFFRGNGIPGVLELMKRGTSLMIRPVVIC